MGLDLFKKPTHLVARDDDDVLGVMAAEELKSKLELICAEIKHPVALYCFYDYEQERDENDQPIFVEGLPVFKLKEGRPKMVRFDSNIASVTLHWCCETFRICAGYKYCIQCDEDHACLFRRIEEINGTYNELPIEVTDLNEFEKLINQQIDDLVAKIERPIYHNPVYDEDGEDVTKPQFIRAGNSGYIDYRCSIMGYHELIFPVIVCGRVLGAIFCGQISKEEDCDTICKTIRKTFMDNRPELFSGYRWNEANAAPSRKCPVSKERLYAHLLDGRDRYKMALQYPAVGPDKPKDIQPYVNLERNPILSSDDFGELLDKVDNQINGLMSDLENTLKQRRKEYIARSVHLVIQKFNSNIPRTLKTIGTDQTTIVAYWKTVEKLLRPLLDKLPIRQFMIFGASNVSMGVGSYPRDEWLPCVVFLFPDWKGNRREEQSLFEFKVDAKDKEEKKFLLHSHPIEGYAKIGSRKIMRRVFYPNRKTSAYDEKANSLNVFYIPVRDNLSHSSAIVWTFCTKESTSDMLQNTVYIENEIRKELVQLATLIFYVNWYLLDSILQTNTELVLRFFRHEIAHVLLGFGSINDTYIQNDNFSSLPYDKRRDVAKDLRSTEDMLRYIEQNIQLLTKPEGEIPIQHEELLIFKEILIKWDLIYKQTLKRKHLGIVLPSVSFYDDYRPKICSDKRLVEQIVYNIVSNAVKYCYWGSNIYIDCIKPTFESNYQLLTVTDFGHHMPDDQAKAYELYFREPDPRLNIDGSGIGLYVVKKISDLLGFTVSHSCKKISDYNVPLIDEYLQRSFRTFPKDEQITKLLKAERARIGPARMQEIARGGRPARSMKVKQLIDMIQIPTYKVTITVRIPIINQSKQQ